MQIVEALSWLDGHLNHESSSRGIAAGRVEGLSLQSMGDLVALLGDPQLDVPTIHITGTNGKGSVAAMVTALVQAHGLQVGTFTSPHLERINERIRRNGEPIPDQDLAEVLTGVAAVEDLLDSRATWFEIITAAAFRYFAEAPVDVAVIEVGLLGRYDATNVVNAEVAVVTGIGGDHTDFADGWEQAVASEKAGIIKADSAAVLGPMDADLRSVFAAEGAHELWSYGVDFEVTDDRLAVGGQVIDLRSPMARYEAVFLPLHGRHQSENLAVAVAAVEAFFGRALDTDLVAEALGGIQVPGRVEVVSHAPLVIIDAAHNPDAIRATAATLDSEFTVAGTRIVVFAMLGGRDVDAAAQALAETRADLVLCTSVGDERSVAAAPLAAACSRAGLNAEVIDNAYEAVGLALVRADDEDLVLVTGSFRLIEAARAAVTAWARPRS